MKTIYLFCFALLCALGCSKVDVPTNTNNNKPTVTTNTDGIFAGSVRWSGADWVKKKNLENSRVELLGTNLSTLTNERGDWVLRGVDSGTYTLRFTRPGCDTFEIRNMHTNGNDSVYATWMLFFDDDDIREQRFVDLMEHTMDLRLTSVNAGITAKTYERIYRHDSVIIRVDRDTTYSFGAQINLSSTGPRTVVAEETPYQIAYIVNEKATMTKADLPNDSVLFITPERGGWWRIDENNMTMKATNGIHTLSGLGGQSESVVEYFTRRKLPLKIGAQLYLHVFPIWVGSNRQIEYTDRGIIIRGGGGQDRARGDVMTIPIEWK